MTTHLARTDDPVTSHEAAETSAKGVKVHVFEMIQHYGSITDAQLEQSYPINAHAYGWPTASPSRLRTARVELVREGKVSFTGEYGVTLFGRRNQKWGVNPSWVS